MLFSDIDVCSNALVLLGLEPISALPDGSPRSNVCAIRYPMLKSRALCSHVWKFTVTKSKLDRDVTTPISAWKYQFHLPGDRSLDGVICAYRSDSIGSAAYTDFVIQDGMLLTDEPTVYVDYQRNVSESLWPAHFTDFIAHALATDVCLSLTKSKTFREQLSLTTYGTPSQNLMGGLHGVSRSQDSKFAPANNIITGFSVRDARFFGNL